MQKNRLKKTLDKINAKLSLHGGGVKLVAFKVKNKEITLKLQGACQGCPMAQLTSENFIKKEIKENLPEIQKINIKP